MVQKYLERTLLLNQRKFDIRVWALLTQENKPLQQSKSNLEPVETAWLKSPLALKQEILS